MKWQLFLIPLFLIAQDDFMSTYEYGEMLYNNPRGISCAKCHGQKGEGEFIGRYYKKDKKTKKEVLVEIYSPSVNTKNFQTILNSVNKVHDVMPTYSLTPQEVKAIYEYLQKKRYDK
ncbi:MAG: cytochrome c [Sulfurovaceae bacterium]|nr:cytochrome c [Sulfurovaceae bacterium]